MKNLFVLSFLILCVSCGDGLVDHSKVSKTTGSTSTPTDDEVEIASNADAIFDAKDLQADCGSATWEDATDNAHDLTITCGGTGGRKGSGTAADPYRFFFDGSNTYAADTYSPGSASMANATWVAWIRPSNTSFSHVISMDPHNGTFNRSLAIDTNYTIFTGSGWDTTQAVTTGQWQFIVIKFSATDTSFTNGTTTTSQGTAPTYPGTGQPFTLGRSGDAVSDSYTGDIAWVAVYPRILTDDEISDTCEALKDRFSGASCD